jgi:hypothetical protein
VSDAQIIGHPDWGLFGLTPTDVLAELRRVGPLARFIVQAGDLVRISFGFEPP